MGKHRRPPVWQASVFAVIPAVWIAWATFFATGGRRQWSVSDFLTFRSAASDLLHGRSPYPPLDSSVLAIGHSFVYPPIAAYPFTPFTALPAHAAIIAYLILSLAAIPIALWILGVRDWRILGIVLLWQPVLMWLIEGPIEPWMLLLLAVGWRWRTHALRLAAVVALLVSLKLFLWPLLVWLLATRRVRAFLASVAMTAVFVLLPFASVGVHALRLYPHLLRMLTSVYGASSFSLLAIFESVMSSHNARIATLIGALALIALIGLIALRSDGDRRAFSVAIVGAVILSPIVWAHYFLLLAAPIALARPRLSLLWCAPLLFWATGAAALGQPHRLAIGVLIPLLVLVAACRGLPTDHEEQVPKHQPAERVGAGSVAQSTGSGSGSVSPAMR